MVIVGNKRRCDFETKSWRKIPCHKANQKQKEMRVKFGFVISKLICRKRKKGEINFHRETGSIALGLGTTRYPGVFPGRNSQQQLDIYGRCQHSILGLGGMAAEVQTELNLWE